MHKLLLTTAILAASAVPSAAGILGIQIFDNATLIDSVSGETTGTADLVTSDANFANIVVSVQGSPVVPRADLSTVTLDASTSGAFTGTHVLTIDIFQTGVNGRGPVESTFTINGLINDPGPSTLSTYEGGTATTLGTLLATHTFAVGDLDDHFGPVTNAAGAFTADASSYAISFTHADQSFGGSTQLTTGVPEPKTWAMLVAGFGLMSLMGLRRRRAARFLALS